MSEIETSWKDTYIAAHGLEAYTKRLERRREWGKKLPGGEKQRSQDRRDADPEQAREYDRAWRERNPEKTKAKGRKVSQKRGAYYKKHMKYRQTGIQGEREKIRCKHGNQWRWYKHLVAPNSEIHHCWCDNSSEYSCIALVEKDKHRHGIIDVIRILDGKIKVLTENEIELKNKIKKRE